MDASQSFTERDLELVMEFASVVPEGTDRWHRAHLLAQKIKAHMEAHQSQPGSTSHILIASK